MRCFTITIMLTIFSHINGQKIVSILGDSYSTFVGYVTPKSNKCFYRQKSKFPNDVHDVTKTWWWILFNEMGYTLSVNNSYSGATVCNTGYGKNDYTDRSFVTRMANIGSPDILFIFGGTNDCWAGDKLGDYKFSNWTTKDLFMFRPAFCYIVAQLQKSHPKMKIINICNSDLDGDYNASMDKICKHYGITNIQLQNIDKQYNHPSIKGMRQISNQIKNVLIKEQQKKQ